MPREIERTPSSLAPMALKPFKPELPFGHPIKVYRNIRTGLWSVMDAKTGKVVGCTDSLVVANAKFQVSAKGIQRIRETRRKRVVAFVVGSFVSYAWDESCQDSVRFNPYEFDFFVDAHGSPVKVADAVNLTPLGWVWARNARVWPPYKP
jgi:hypothetical protein